MAFTKVRRDVQQEITDTIIAQIEAGAGKWTMPWHARPGDGFSAELPVNTDGRAYRGLNIILLWGSAMAKGYSRPIWGTFKKWEKLGAFPRKGEKGTLAFYWTKRCNICGASTFNVSAHFNESHPGETQDFRMTCVAWNLFNIEQLAEVPAKFTNTPAPVAIPEDKRIAAAEKFFASVPAKVNHGGNRAYYTTGGDYIQMPHFEQFNTPEDYYSTRGHETVHWSGHETRCNREFGKRFGDNAYAFEELVAELGAAFLCAHLGISNEPRPDHAQYLTSWLETLKGDKYAIFTAASRAQDGVNFIFSQAGDTSTDDDENDGEEIPLAA
jgi:antirestriction protein ArdC